MTANDPMNVKKTLKIGKSQVSYYSLKELAKKKGYQGVDKLPVSIKILLEAALRQIDGFQVSEKDVKFIAGWKKKPDESSEIPFKPARVVMQDFTGVPAVVDLAVMRDAIVERLGGDPRQINPVLDVDLVIDHSVQIDFYGTKNAFKKNVALEFARNKERYEFLKWGAETFANFRVVPPATGIVHQVNLEYLAPVVKTKIIEGEIIAYPDSLVGTDSHTTMINGLGVLGWGVGGIEAEAALLDQPLYMLLPEVVGFKLTGKLPEGATATDLVLRVTQMLRKHGVVGKFVEFYGPGLSKLSLPDRATIANMAPEYGATCGFFPVDKETLNYLKRTNRSKGTIDLVAAYCKAQGLFRTDNTPDPIFSSTLKLDLSTVKPSLSGPKRPHDRFDLKDSKAEFAKAMADFTKDANRRKTKTIKLDGNEITLGDGSIVIAAITSCTNTSNPSVLMAAGLLAKKAVEKGLSVPPYVKTSLAPGSRVVTRYLEKAGLQKSLDKLGFNVVGYGCTTCIGNSGPLRPEISAAIQEADFVACAVLSGNRNFEGRIHADVKANYLASPPLVVAYALAGTMDIDLYKEPLGHDKKGKPVFLKDIWPSQKEIQNAVAKAITSKMYAEEYGVAFKGDAMWRAIKTSKGERYTWDEQSTYIRKPPYFDDLTAEPGKIQGISGARCLAYLGDSVTTDHISPAGNISKKSPAAQWLIEHGVQPADFNQYGARRGNHEVMVRGTFANIRIKNKLVPGVEGGVTRYLPTGEQLSIYDAAMKYKADGTPLVILAGAEYGSGSSRDWAAKGTFLQGVKAVIAKSYERIHRSNLIGMGVLPLQFKAGEDAATLGLTGEETFDIVGLDDNLKPQVELTVIARGTDGEKRFTVLSRVDTAVEVEYLRNGGILHTVLKNMAKAARV